MIAFIIMFNNFLNQIKKIIQFFLDFGSILKQKSTKKIFNMQMLYFILFLFQNNLNQDKLYQNNL